MKRKNLSLRSSRLAREEDLFRILNEGYYIGDQVKSFLDKNPSYSQRTLELFQGMNLKSNRIEINETDLKNLFEKERLFRKFNYNENKESER